MNKTRRDYLVTFATEMLAMAGMVLLFRVAARYWGVDGFAEFSLVRRVGNLLTLPLAVGVGVALARYVAIALAENRSQDKVRFLAAGLSIGLLPALLFNLLILVAGRPLAQLLFSDPGFEPDLAALGVLILGINFHTVTYGYLRGQQKMPLANLLQITNKAVIPLAVFLRPGLDVAGVFKLVGIIQILVSLVASLVILVWHTPRPWNVAGWPVQLRELLKFGAPRVPGEFALTGLLGLPAIFIAHSTDPTTAGLFAFSLSLLVMLGGVFTPLGLVMLPQLSALQARGQVQEIPRIINRFLVGALTLAVGVAVGFHFLGETIIRLYLGPAFVSAAPLAKTVLWAAVPYMIYIVLRNALDALWVKPLNTKNLLIALAVLLVLQPVVHGAAGQAWAILAAMTVLGVLSFLDYRRLLGKTEDPDS